jgi:hypothetical protein
MFGLLCEKINEGEANIMPVIIESDALLSKDKEYRYWLKRVWDKNKQMVAFLMLNPSCADEHVSDPTIDNCVKLADFNGFGGMWIVNLFAYREPKKGELKKEKYPIGIDNDKHITSVFSQVSTIVLAYGNPDVKTVKNRIQDIMSFIGVQSKLCISKTNDGYPLHPGMQGLNGKKIDPAKHKFQAW